MKHLNYAVKGLFLSPAPAAGVEILIGAGFDVFISTTGRLMLANDERNPAREVVATSGP